MHRHFHRLRALAAVALAAALLAPQVFADTWPSRPIKLVVPFAPAGATDTRAYKPDTAVIADLDRKLLGYISPHGTTYRFDAAGESHTVGFGSRNTSITAFFRKNDPPTLTPIEG